MRSRLGRLGLMTMAAVLAVGLCGAAFASWTNDLVVQGIVETGEVNLVIEGTSQTFVYKDLDDGTMFVGDEMLTEEDMEELNYLYVASAYVSSFDAVNDTASMVFDNIFPGPEFKADLLVHYYGVPAHVSVTKFLVDEALAPYVWYEIVWPDGSISTSENAPVGDFGVKFVTEGEYQLHECETFRVNVYAQIPQEMSLRDLSAEVTLELGAIQWNLCEPPVVEKALDLPDYKVRIDVVDDYNGSGGYFKASFSELSASEPVPPIVAIEPQPMDAWCCELENGTATWANVWLKSSLEAPYTSNSAWNKINWVLNKSTYMAQDYGPNATVNLAGFGTVYAGSPAQVAFWYFLWGPSVVTNPDGAALAIIAAAEANGATFVPGSGQLAAVICEDGATYQTAFIALDP